MNARANLITATLTLSLIVPAAASAARPQHPRRRVSARSSRPLHLHTLKANSSAIGLGAYNACGAYVHGGASQKVAKAIASAASSGRQSSRPRHAPRPAAPTTTA